jgi:hypothetical protein
VSKLSAKGWKNLVAKDKDKIKHHRHEIQVLAGETGLEIGEFRKPAIMVSRPALMRLAMAISPSRESSSTEPISRRYMRTGSWVRSVGSFASDFAGTFCWTLTSSPLSLSASSSGSSRSPSSLEQINSLSKEVNSEQIEDVLAMFSEMGVNVVETEEAPKLAAAAGWLAYTMPMKFAF